MTKTHTTLETEKEQKPFDAPLSITKREQLERQVASPSPVPQQFYWVVRDAYVP